MTPPALLIALLARLEPRHWLALAASAALHAAVYLSLDAAPPAEPAPVSFEIALQPPEAQPPIRVKPQAKVADAKARKSQAKRKPAKREAHTLEAKWRGEAEPAKDAPRLELPDARVLGIQAPVEPVTPPAALPRSNVAKTAAAQASGEEEAASASRSAVQAPSQAAEAAPFSEPAAVTGRLAGTGGGAAAEPGIALAASTSLSRGGIQPGSQARGGQGSEAGMIAGGHTGPGGGAFAASQGSGSGLDVVAGAGAHSRASLEAAALSGGEPEGIRLTASGTLSERANLPAGSGALAAGPHAVDSGRAVPQPARGEGASLTSAQAGGRAANPLEHADRRPGGAAAAAAPGAAGARAEGAGPGRLARAGDADKAGVHPANPGDKGKAAGSVANERGSSAGGDTSSTDHALAVSLGRTGTPAADSRPIGRKAGGGAASSTGQALALAAGEPGSSPNLAVTLPALVAKPGPGRGERSGSGGGIATGGSGSAAYPGTASLATGTRAGALGNPGGLALAGSQGGAPAAAGVRIAGGGHGSAGGGAPTHPPGVGEAADREAAPEVRLVTVKMADRQAMRVDSQLQALDVLAPSTYCPLPLPGHGFPDNRPPRAEPQLATQPAYAPDNPPFVFPIQAWAGNIQGKVIVRVEVQADGRPGRMWLKQSSGSGLLDRDAQSQLRFWRFIPARQNGQPVTAWIDVPVVYRLQDAKK